MSEELEELEKIINKCYENIIEKSIKFSKIPDTIKKNVTPSKKKIDVKEEKTNDVKEEKTIDVKEEKIISENVFINPKTRRKVKIGSVRHLLLIKDGIVDKNGISNI